METITDLYSMEELVNALTHGIGIVLFLVLCPLIIATAVQSRNQGKIIGACCFAFGLLAVYSSSTLFHAIHDKFTKEVLHYFDLLSIYFLIAGSYTAYILVYFRDRRGFTLLGLIWVVSLVGINCQVFFPNMPPIISLLLYLILGWVGIALIKPSLKKVPTQILGLIIAGGIAYSIGTYFFYYDNRLYYHAIWHVFVILGSLMHWIGIYFSIRE